MDDLKRYNRDKATVMSIIKYMLFVLIVGALLYVSSKLVVIILPFLLGFVLSKASRHLANQLIRLGNFFSRNRAKRKARRIVATNPNLPDNVTDNKSYTPAVKKTPFRWQRVLFPSMVARRYSFKTRLTLVVYAFLVIIVIGSLLWSLIALVAQMNKVIANLPNWLGDANLVDRIESIINSFSTQEGGFLSVEMADSILQYFSNLQETLSANIPSMVSSLVKGLLNFIGNIPIVLFFMVVIVMSGVYFITDGKKLLRFFAKNIKSRLFRHKSFLLLDQLSSTLFRVLGGYLALLIITFFEALAIFYLAGVNYAVILALVTAILDFMPVLGVSATMVPVMIYLIIQGDYIGVLILLIGMVIITVVRRVIEPSILGNAMNMHPMATLFAMIIGVAVWGAIGFLVGPVVLLILIEVLKVFSFDKKLRDFAGRILNKVGN